MLELDLIPRETIRPLSRAEYDRMVALGWFDDERVELLKGVLVTMSPMGPRHVSIVSILTDLLVLAIRKRAYVQIQGPLALADDSEPEPDVALVPRGYEDELPDRAYLVNLEEEFVEGKDLKTWCEAQGGIDKVPLEVRLEIIVQAAEALQAAHDTGIIHRDVKPGNILISGDLSGRKPPSVKLTDFGIGQVISAEYLKGVTQAGFTQTMLGSTSTGTSTTMYLAPEIVAGNPATTRSDIYSLGVVLYQFLVGDLRRPLVTDWEKNIADPLLREDLQHCFMGNPEERFVGAGQLARNLRAWRASWMRTIRAAGSRPCTRNTGYPKRSWPAMPCSRARLR